MVGGPHLSTLPDGFLPAIAKSLHRYADSFINKPNIVESEVLSAITLVKALIVMCRNVDNLQPLTNSTCVGDALAIAQTLLSDEFHPKVESRVSTNYCDFLYFFRTKN